MFLKVCDLAVDCNMCMTELGTLLRKLGKFCIAFNKPQDSELTSKIVCIFERTKTMNMDEDDRAMIPHTFKGLCQIYHKNIQVLVDLYKSRFSPFMKREIEIGKPEETKPEKPSQPKSIYYDLIEKEKSKHFRENFDDTNFHVNRMIANNLHFLFGAFVSCSEKSEELLSCIQDVLKIYTMLLKTKDRELLHHVLFSFKNYHDAVSKVEIWATLSDEVREMYQEILKHKIRATEKILEYSWRYHATYVKVLETIIDS